MILHLVINLFDAPLIQNIRNIDIVMYIIPVNQNLVKKCFVATRKSINCSRQYRKLLTKINTEITALHTALFSAQHKKQVKNPKPVKKNK